MNTPNYASWSRRVVAALIDNWVLAPAFFLVQGSGHVLSVIAGFGFWIWNCIYRVGNTGKSVGRSVTKLRVVDGTTGQPVGARRMALRFVAHVVDIVPIYAGLLRPFWNPKSQTWADSIVNTVVVHDVVQPSFDSQPWSEAA